MLASSVESRLSLADALTTADTGKATRHSPAPRYQGKRQILMTVAIPG